MSDAPAIPQDARIYVAGHRGMVGGAILRALQARGHTQLITRTRSELDLQSQAAVREFFAREKPTHVFLAAAKVGGIHANNVYRADFIYQNLLIETNVIGECWKNGVERLLFLGSSCIYPKFAPQPITEDALLGGTLEPTNQPYAIAKIAGIELCDAFRRQYGCDFRAAMPTNLYGPGDNFDLNTSHVVPALLRKFHEAHEANAAEVMVWGTGTPRREFLYVDDLADACLFLMGQDRAHWDASVTTPHVNVGIGSDVTIAELAQLVAQTTGFKGALRFDTSKPDGTPRKLMDSSLLARLGWTPKTALGDGLRESYAWFRRHGAGVRA